MAIPGKTRSENPKLPAKRRSRDYSEVEVEAALRALVWCSGNTRRASRLLAEAGQRKVPRGTLKDWTEPGGLYAHRYAELSVELRPEINRHLAAAHEALSAAYLEAEWELLRALRDKIPEMRGDQLANAGNKFAIAGAVHADKSFRYQGEPTEIRHGLSVTDALKKLKAIAPGLVDVNPILIGEAEIIEDEQPELEPRHGDPSDPEKNSGSI